SASSAFIFFRRVKKLLHVPNAKSKKSILP
ncbi:MAG: hypothetical protein ACI9HK_005816, partial [Pirellulaceae bacterium]